MIFRMVTMSRILTLLRKMMINAGDDANVVSASGDDYSYDECELKSDDSFSKAEDDKYDGADDLDDHGNDEDGDDHLEGDDDPNEGDDDNDVHSD